LVTFVETPGALAEALAREQEAATVIPTSSSLAADLRSFLEDAVAALPAPLRA
jgi:hypothetical protein